jgi:hypothetical protein
MAMVAAAEGNPGVSNSPWRWRGRGLEFNRCLLPHPKPIVRRARVVETVGHEWVLHALK